jgi:hypothetical protein
MRIIISIRYERTEVNRKKADICSSQVYVFAPYRCQAKDYSLVEMNSSPMANAKQKRAFSDLKTRLMADAKQKYPSLVEMTSGLLLN